MRNTCVARRYNDQYLCDACALQWDVKDPEPPKCLDAHERHLRAMEALFPTPVEDEPVKQKFYHYEGWR